MRSVKSALFLLGGATFAANLVVACSGDDRTAFVESDGDAGRTASLPGTAEPQDSDEKLPDADKPPSKQDSGGGDAGADDASDGDDSGGIYPTPDGGDGGDSVTPLPDAGAAGSPCSPVDTIQQQSCGLCGVQYRLCAPVSAEPDAATVWQDWGYCQDELVDGCAPGTTVTESCGLCGTRQKVCQNDCRFAAGACKNEPANACTPGTVDFQEGLSCVEGGRSRTCQDSCTYGPFGACFTPGEPDVPELEVPSTVGDKIVGDFVLTSSEKLPRLSGTCPNASASNAERPSNWIRLKNPSSNAVKVTVWTLKSSKPDSTVIDTVIASYGKTFPNTQARREACVAGVIDGCADGAAGDPTSCLNSWAALHGTDAVTIGANSHAYIWVGGWADSSVGDYSLAVRTDFVN